MASTTMRNETSSFGLMGLLVVVLLILLLVAMSGSEAPTGELPASPAATPYDRRESWTARPYPGSESGRTWPSCVNDRGRGRNCSDCNEWKKDAPNHTE